MLPMIAVVIVKPERTGKDGRTYQGTHLTGIIARLAENAAKVALIKAITDNPGSPQITRSFQLMIGAVHLRPATEAKWHRAWLPPAGRMLLLASTHNL